MLWRYDGFGQADSVCRRDIEWLARGVDRPWNVLNLCRASFEDIASLPQQNPTCTYTIPGSSLFVSDLRERPLMQPTRSAMLAARHESPLTHRPSSHLNEDTSGFPPDTAVSPTTTQPAAGHFVSVSSFPAVKFISCPASDV